MDLRYPIGKFSFPQSITADQRRKWIADIGEAPARMRAAVAGLSAAQLDTPYREGGWTVRQVVHHLPDSHLNAYVRFKLALTEDEPIIRPYREELWAELPEAKTAAPGTSLALLESLHRRWVMMLRAMQPEQWKRRFRHPEIGPLTLEKNLALYAWHGRHHVAHITSLRERMRW